MTQNDCLFFVSIINTCFSKYAETDLCIFPICDQSERTTSYGFLLLFARLLRGIYPSGFIFMTLLHQTVFTPVMHPQRTLPPPFFFSSRRSSFGPEQHTPLIASSCLFYWVIGSIMHCGIYLWARMLCSAHWGHSCQQEYQREVLILGWTCENYIPG